MELEEQLMMFDRYCDLACERVLQFMVEERYRILLLARRRLREGHKQYGDSSWARSQQELTDELLAELADACNYMVMKLSGADCS